MNFASFVPIAGALLLAPLLPGVIQRTKALAGGRRGPPVLQTYYDLAKLLRKGAVYSRTAGWVFRAGPMVGLAASAAALALVPFGALPAVLAFPGDVVLLAGLLALARFFTIVAALDTGSAFEGMGASREAQFAALAEPAFLLALAAAGRATGSLSLSAMAPAIAGGGAWQQAGPVLVLVAAALFIVFLAENARIPVDDPATHLELTMIHEVMVLDHGGPDLAFIVYGAALKLWVLGAVLVEILVPARSGNPWVDAALALAGLLGLAVAVGVIESVMARLRLVRVPQLLAAAGAFAALAILLVLR